MESTNFPLRAESASGEEDAADMVESKRRLTVPVKSAEM